MDQQGVINLSSFADLYTSRCVHLISTDHCCRKGVLALAMGREFDESSNGMFDASKYM